MPRFTRKQKPPRCSDYQLYRPYLRIDFRFRCAYCDITEIRWGSERNFGVDHFRPKSLFPKLALRYANLYYACNRCNEIKGATWPSAKLARSGFVFVDPCRVHPEDHMQERADGHLSGKTRSGDYTIAHCRLNRPLLVEWRRERSALIQDIAETNQIVRMIRGSLVSRLDPELAERLEQLLKRHNELCRRLSASY